MSDLQLSPDIKTCRPAAQLPRPAGLPLIGNAHALKLSKLHLVLEDWARQHGEIYHFRVFNQQHVVVACPELIKDIMRARPEGFARLGKLRDIEDTAIAEGVFSAEGDQWKRQRKLLMPALSNASLGKTMEHMQTCTARLMQLWQGAPGQDIDVLTDIMRYTVDVTSLMVFGHDMNTLEQGDNQLQRDIARIFSEINFRINFPVPYWRYIHLPRDREYSRAKDSVEKHVYALIDAARQRMTQDPVPHNLIESMLVASDPETPGAKLSDNEVYANALTMLLAGEDTTANTLAWLVYHLSQSSAQQEKIRAEMSMAVGAGNMLSDLKQTRLLPYTLACIQEVMRLRSTAPVFFIENIQPVALRGTWLPARTPIYLLSRYAGLQNKYCADPQRFLPERWLAQPDAVAVAGSSNPAPNQPPSAPVAQVPFGFGPRICAGMNLAMLEMAVMITTLCQHFSIEPAQADSPVSEVFGLTMKPEGVRVRLRRR